MINKVETFSIESEEFRTVIRELNQNKMESKAKDEKIDKLEKKQKVLENMVKELIEKII
jgi:predicted transcriptional regulator